MPAKYSEDLRWRAVWLHLIRGLSVSEIADVLFVCKRNVEPSTMLLVVLHPQISSMDPRVC